jgi:hypothetical protein
MLNIPTKISLALTLAATLIGCGGGGGGATPIDPVTVAYQTPVLTDTYRPLVTGVDNGLGVISEVYRQDLNSDGVSEVIITGRKDATATAAEWQSLSTQIYGWNTGSFTNETSTWLSGNDGVIVGTDQSVQFGDFNGDGNIDMAFAASTDRVHTLADLLVYMNTGSNSFTRITLQSGVDWSHDSVVFDFNKDGFDDIMVTDFGGTPSLSYGSINGTFDINIVDSASKFFAAGISAADYLNDGSVTVIMTDHYSGSGSGDGNDDTTLYSFATNAGVLTFTEIARLPASIFSQPQWADQLADPDELQFGQTAAHGIRNVAMDFNNDLAMDVIVVDRLVNYNVIQFLQNDGSGNFTDVTDSILVGYQHFGNGGSYTPQIMDFNNDGLDDIFVSGNDFDGTVSATRVLVQSSDGKFVELYSDVFSDFYREISAIQVGDQFMYTWGNPINIVTGPSNEQYLVTFTSGSTHPFTTIMSNVYSAKLGIADVIAPQTTSELQTSDWPFTQ